MLTIEIYGVNISFMASSIVAAERSSYHHGNLRAALLEAAIEVLEQEGFAGLSLRAVARRAGVSHTAPYNHFADLQDLLAAVATEGFRRLGASIESAAAAAASPRERLLALARGYLALPSEHPALYRLMFGNEIRDRSAYPELVSADDAIADTARQVTADCLALSSRRSVATETASAAGWALVHGLASLLTEDQVRLPSGRTPGREFQEEIAQLFLEALIPEDALGREPARGRRRTA